MLVVRSELLILALQQAALLGLAALVLDGGYFMKGVAGGSVVFWLIYVFVVTSRDRTYLARCFRRWGLPPVALLSGVITNGAAM